MKKFITGAVVMAALTACGGGGDGGNTQPPSATFNADAAFSGALTNGAVINGMSAKDNAGNAYTLSVSFSAGTQTTFFGSTQKMSTETIIVTKNGSPAGTASGQVFYSTGPTTIIGEVAANGSGLFKSFKPSGNMPTAGTVGSSGPFNTYIIFPSASIGVSIGTGSTSWSLEPDTATTAFICLNTTSLSESPGSTCLKINGDGTIQGGRFTVSLAGQLLTFR